MPPKAALLALLASLATLLALPARASTIDDFTLTGGGLTLAYSLPATSSYPDYSLFNFFSEGGATTINGVPGYSVSGSYYDTAIFHQVSVEYFFPTATGLAPLVLLGPTFINFAFVPATNPPPYLQEDVVPTFVPGTYTLYPINSDDSVPYTLQITQEVAAATPELPTLALLATAALGLLAIPTLRKRPTPAVAPAPTRP